MRLVINECKDLACEKDIRIFLNGSPVHRVTIADEERGFIERLMVDPAGKIVIDHVQQDVVRVIERGTVRIEIRERQ